MVFAVNVLQVQAASGMIFSVFGAAHMLNVASVGHSEEMFNSIQLLLQEVYHKPIVEGVLVASAVVHVSCGALRAYRRRNSTALVSRSTTAMRYSGWALAAMVSGHAFGSRVLPHMFGFNFDFGSVSYLVQNYDLHFVPALFVLTSSLAVHGSLGGSRALQILINKRLSVTTSELMAVVGVAASAALVAMVTIRAGNSSPLLAGHRAAKDMVESLWAMVPFK